MTSPRPEDRAIGEIEASIGVLPLDRLHAQRADLIAQVAPLRALYGAANSGWDARRKVLLALQARKIREKFGTAKASEALIDEQARTTDAYQQFVDESLLERARWIVLEDKIAAINERIERDKSLIYHSNAELRLA